MKAAFIASFIRTGHLDNPNWRVIRFTLHRWIWGQNVLQTAVALLVGEGYSRLMAVAIAQEFSKQCRNRNSFAKHGDDTGIYEVVDTPKQAKTKYDYDKD